MMIIIPLQIPSQNDTERGRSCRGRAAKTKERRNTWALHCKFRMAQANILPATGPRKLTITAYRKRLCYDIGNLIGGGKSCVDGLVDARLLLDDRDSKAAISYNQMLASVSPLGIGKVCTVLEIEDTP